MNTNENNSGTLKFSNPVKETVFQMTGYRFDGTIEDIEVVVKGGFWNAFLLIDATNPDTIKIELIGSRGGPFRSDIQKEVDGRGLNAIERPTSLFDKMAKLCKPV